jgi:hypothetical protein
VTAISVEHETARPPAGEGFVDAVTISWGDARADVFGLARLALAGGRGSALAVLFSGGMPVAALARDDLAPNGGDWAQLELDGLATSVRAPLERWSVRFGSADGQAGFELELEAASAPAALAGDDPVARAGGMEGYEQLCHVRGTATVAGRAVEVACLGQRGHSWGAPDWSRIELARSLAAWPEGGPAVALTAIRPAGVENHSEEAVWSALLSPEEVSTVREPRLSTTYDGDGHQRRAGFELWVAEEDDYPQRGAGEVLCGSTIELGSLALDCAFFRWHMEGREGVGRYDVLRRA